MEVLPASRTTNLPPLQSPMANQQISHYLCPKLVVPRGVEFVIAVQDVLSRKRQELDFEIVDLAGNSLCRVLVCERERDGANCGIQMQYINKEPLAFIRTGMLYDASTGLPEICRADGHIHCRVILDQSVPPMGKYALQSMDGEPLMFFQGDFQSRAINGIAPNGIIVSTSQRCTLELANAPHYAKYYKMRIAPAGDIALLLCGMLAIDKIETRSYT
jgi:hypothetical protein